MLITKKRNYYLDKSIKMKKFIIIICSVIFISCNNHINVKENTHGSEPKITYYKDCRTGLCFAEIVQSNNVTGHACVPCDSVKKFLKNCNTNE